MDWNGLLYGTFSAHGFDRDFEFQHAGTCTLLLGVKWNRFHIMIGFWNQKELHIELVINPRFQWNDPYPFRTEEKRRTQE